MGRLRGWLLVALTSQCPFDDGDLERKLEDRGVRMLFNEHSWAWNDNPFVGTPQLNGLKVLVIDKRPHIAGNAYDEYNDDGILVHRYGPHIFHTNSREVFDYLSRFTEWRPYEHRVQAFVRGQLVPIPINRTTLNKLFDANLKTDEDAAE